jgi:hypothetical protein
MTSIRRATFISPAAALTTFALGAYVATRLADGPLPPGATAYLAFLFSFFGIPVAYVGAALLATPAYWLLRNRGKLSASWVIASAALISATWAVCVSLIVAGWPSTDDLSIPIVVAALGAFAAVVGGAVFTALGGLRTDLAPPASVRCSRNSELG